MSSRDKDTKILQDMLKVFFKKGGSAPLPARNELVVSAELERELSAEVPLYRRLRAMKELAEKALVIRISEGSVKKLWSSTRDLLDDPSAENRHAALVFLRCIAEGQADELLIMRTILFHYLRDTHATHAPEDAQLRFRLLHTLTNTGKNIKCFEEQIGAFLLEWLPQIQTPTHIVEFLQLIINVVKFNATYLDEDIVHGIVNNACYLCEYSPEAAVVLCGISLLEAVVSYSLLPRAALPAFVAALCRTVNLEHYCQNSWKLMRSVLGADIGHATLQELVEVLNNAGDAAPGAPAATGASSSGAPAAAGGAAADAGLVRGAVFYISMALWGPRRVHTLHVSYLAVLPAFLKALEIQQPVVTYEVVLAIQSLVSRAAQELHEPAWDCLLQVIRRVLDQDKMFEPANELIHTCVHALITSLEQLQDSGLYFGDHDALLDLVDYCGHDRPEASAMRLITARAGALRACGAGAAGVAGALALAERYVRRAARAELRLHTLAALLAFVQRDRLVYGAELIERVGVPLLHACALDAEPAVRAAAARALPRLARLTHADCTDLIDLLEKILNRPFEVYSGEGGLSAGADASDCALAAAGLVRLLHDKLPAAPAPAARALLVLLDHLDQHYKRPAVFLHHPEIRTQILEMVFGLRANSFNCVGFCYDAAGQPVHGAAAARLRPLCSPLLLCEPLGTRAQPPPVTPLPPGACAVGAGRAARALTAALTRECEWSVLGGVLRALPALLHARALALGRRAHDLDLLASTLCSMVSDRSLYFPECVRTSGGVGGGGGGGGGKLLLSEFHAAALPALAALAPHHTCLEPQTQQRIVRCLLKYGMVLRTPQPYINALTIFTLEMRETMVKMLPEVLLDLSKISDTKAIASPMLEFLSTLTRLPRVFASFVEDQYMSVFAILLPYTNPSRYNHYVVSLAHHVIAAWFLKCRLSYRRNFVRFIIHGLHNYIIMPFEEQLQYKSNNFQQNANEDSSNRQRSSSLGSKAVSRAPTGGSASAAFHVELTETCVDLLARYTSTPCSVKPQRSDLAEFLFTGGQSMTWLVGHKLITITTSGCLQNSIKQGLCDRCAVLCKQHSESVAAPTELDHSLQAQLNAHAAAVQVQLSDGASDSNGNSSGGLQQPEVKRYSKHSLQHSRSTETSSSSLSISEPLLPPSSGHSTRQNSSENNKTMDHVADVLNQFTQRFERISKEVDTEEPNWSRVGNMAGAACPCWCARWAEVHVRAPTGDLSFVLRVQNQLNWDHMLEWPLEEVAALLSPDAPPPSSASSGIGDSRLDHSSESESRSRSGSASSQSRPRAAPQPDLHKSSSDSVVASERKPPHAASHCIVPPHSHSHSQTQPLRMSTQPINIPGSPQRQTAASAADDDDMLLIVPEGKSRHPVRRSNSSPEMSSSWSAELRAPPAPPGLDLDLVLLPSEPASTAVSLHASKKAAKKSDMRVSCEAIPEEMSGTSPLAPASHPHLMTYNSDPGTVDAQHDGNNSTTGAHPNAHHQLQKTASDSTVTTSTSSLKPPAAPRTAVVSGGSGGGASGGGSSGGGASGGTDLPPLARSKRSHTISVMSPTRRHRENPVSRPGSSSGGGGGGGSGGGGGGASGAVGGGGGGVTPAFVFLQLYHNMSTYPITPPVPGEAPASSSPLSERPLRVAGVQHERTIKNLDLVPPVETYKVGVLYVGPGQHDNEVLILKNEYGSVRYAEFLSQLGTLVSLEAGDEHPQLFLNLEKGGKDGHYTYVWHDDIMQVLFHVATAMPSLAKDPTCNEKRKYIGNDYVSIVYNDSGQDFNISTIKGQFNFCVVVVEPYEHGLNRVLIKTKDERIRSTFLAHADTHVVSDCNVALLARQLALHAHLAAQISQSLRLGGAAYASNSLERLRLLKRLRRRLEAERLARARPAAPYAPPAPLHAQLRVAVDDFNAYT